MSATKTQSRTLSVQVNVLCGPGKERTGWVCPELSSALVGWSHDPRVARFSYEPVIGRHTSQLARNDIADKFLASGFNWLLMIDNDVRPVHPKTNAVLNYLALIDLEGNYPIVGVPMPTIRGMSWYVNAFMIQGDRWRNMSINEIHGAEDGRFVPCDAVGFGAVAIRRDAVEAVVSNEWTFTDANKVMPTDLQEDDVVFLRSRDGRGGTEVGEDILFCRRAKELGFQTYAAPALQSGHYHTVDLADLPAIEFCALSPVDLGVTGPFPDPDEFTLEMSVLSWIKDRIDLGDVHNAIELGSGMSTLVIGHAFQRWGSWNGTLISIETDSDYALSTKHFIDANNLTHITLSGSNCDPAISRAGPYDLLLVDGPRVLPEHPKDRAVAVEYFCYLKPNAYIVMDDADRPGESSIISDWVNDGLVKPEIQRLGRAAILRFVKPPADERYAAAT